LSPAEADLQPQSTWRRSHYHSSSEIQPRQLRDYAIPVLVSDASGWFPVSDVAEEYLAERIAAAVKIKSAIVSGAFGRLKGLLDCALLSKIPTEALKGRFCRLTVLFISNNRGEPVL